MEMKGCPLLIQSDTMNSFTVEGESDTRTYMLPCITGKCVAFGLNHGRLYCKRFESYVEIYEENDNE